MEKKKIKFRSVNVYAFMVMLVVLLLLPFIGLSSYMIRTITMIFYYATLGIGVNIISGYAGQLSIGHSAFFGLAAYSTAILLKNYGFTPWIGGLLGVFLAILGALFIGFIVLRLRGPYFTLSTIAIAGILEIIAHHWRSLTGGAEGIIIPFRGESSIFKFQFMSNRPYYYAILVLMLIGLYITYRIANSKFGYYLSAIRENQDAAEAIGVDLTKNKVKALVISATLTGLVGVFHTVYIRYVDPASTFGLNLSIQIILVAALGGLGTVWGPVLGAVILVPLTEVSNIVFGSGRAGASMLLYAILLMFIVLFSPKGLIVWLERPYEVILKKFSKTSEGGVYAVKN